MGVDHQISYGRGAKLFAQAHQSKHVVGGDCAHGAVPDLRVRIGLEHAQNLAKVSLSPRLSLLLQPLVADCSNRCFAFVDLRRQDFLSRMGLPAVWQGVESWSALLDPGPMDIRALLRDGPEFLATNRTNRLAIVLRRRNLTALRRRGRPLAGRHDHDDSQCGRPCRDGAYA